jgi:PAS domain S-box-containing protein
MIKPFSIFKVNSIPCASFCPLFFALFLPLIAVLGLFFYLHTLDAIHHETLLTTAQYEKAGGTVHGNQAYEETLAEMTARLRHSHLVLFFGFLVGALPFFWWLSLLVKSAQENRAQLAAQEEQYRHLYENAPLPYQSLDEKGRILNVNRNWLAAMGYEQSEVIGRDFAHFVAPSSLADFLKAFSSCLGPGVKQECGCELELIKKDGSALFADFRSEFIFEDSGDCFQAHCIFSDVTELRAEQRASVHLRILLQTIINLHRLIGGEKDKQTLIRKCCDILVTNRGYGSAWIILLDAAGKVEFHAESGLNHDLDQLVSRINLGGFPACILECQARQMTVTIDAPSTFCRDCPLGNGYPRQGVMCASVVHGSSVHGYLNVSLHAEFLQDPEEYERFAEVAADIGYALFNLDQQEKKRQMETALLQSETRLRSITDSAQDAIMMMDVNGAISYWNPAAEIILGYSAEEALGRDLHTLLAPARYHETLHAALPEFFRSGRGNAIGRTLEVAALHKDGREFPVALSLSAVFQDGGWQAVGILSDISERKKMEERMLQSEKMTTIAGLAAGVAHEINTPLSAILQSIQVIRQSLSPELARNQEVAQGCGLDLTRVQDYFDRREITFFLDGIHDSAVKSGRIIADLLQFSRPQKAETASADLAVLLDKSVELVKTDYTMRKQFDILNVEIIREYAPDAPLVSCVAMEIEQVFINLLKNAVQSMGSWPDPGPGARIILRVRRHGELVRVEIEDNGPGMDEATRRHIFDPFFTTKDVGAGTGLGLSVSYTIIVTKCGGRLSVRSAPGQGATFVVELPVNP